MATLLVLVAGAWLSATADAKLCVAIDAPRTARVGAIVTVRVTALLPRRWVGSRPVELEPAAMPPNRRLVVAGPRGEWRETVLRRTSSAEVALARVRLTGTGSWILSVSGWEYAPRACAPKARIVVR